MLLNIVKESLVKYKANPILVLPSLITMIAGFAPSALSSFYPIIEGFQPFTPEFRSFITVGIGFLLIIMFISFLCVLGQASMTGKAVTTGKAELSDWSEGIRRYFLRVLGISLVYVGVLLLSLTLIVVMFTLTLMRMPASLQVPKSFLFLTVNSTTIFLITALQSLFYLLLAPAIIDDKSVGASLDAGIRALRKSGLTFLSFIALFFCVSVATALLREVPSLLGAAIQPFLGSLTPAAAMSQAVNAIFAPVWFLIAFIIYKEQTLV
jgi:hypothetical protein